MRIWARLTALILAVALVATTFVPIGLSISTSGMLSISMRQVGADAGWLADWEYRIEKTIAGAGSVAGTVTVANGGTAVTGSGTAFLEWNVGDKIQIPVTTGDWYTISAITNATSLTISAGHSGGASAVSYDMKHINYPMRIDTAYTQSISAAGKHMTAYGNPTSVGTHESGQQNLMVGDVVKSGSTFYHFYSSCETWPTFKVRYRTSTDWITWTEQGEIIDITDHAADYSWTSPTSVAWSEADSLWYMFLSSQSKYNAIFMLDVTYYTANSANFPDTWTYGGRMFNANDLGHSATAFYSMPAVLVDMTHNIQTADGKFYFSYSRDNSTGVGLIEGTELVPTMVASEDFEWGSNNNPISNSGGSVTWTIAAGSPVISTEQSASGTRSVKLPPAADCSFPLTAATNYSIAVNGYKENATVATYFILHGNGTKAVCVYVHEDENLMYYDGAQKDTGQDVSADTWFLLEVKNINWTAGTFDIYLNYALAKTAATMFTTASYANVFAFLNTDTVAGRDAYADNVNIYPNNVYTDLGKVYDVTDDKNPYCEAQTLDSKLHKYGDQFVLYVAGANAVGNTRYLVNAYNNGTISTLAHWYQIYTPWYFSMSGIDGHTVGFPLGGRTAIYQDGDVIKILFDSQDGVDPYTSNIYYAYLEADNIVSFAGKSQTDFGDIRFTQSDGETALPYWLHNDEKINSDFCPFTVNVNEVPSVGKNGTIYIYYGHKDLNRTTTSSGANTFTFFDDFTTDLTKWTVTGTAVISGSNVHVGKAVTDDYITCKDTFGPGHAFMTSAKLPSGDNKVQFVVMQKDATNYRSILYDTANSANNMVTSERFGN